MTEAMASRPIFDWRQLLSKAGFGGGKRPDPDRIVAIIAISIIVLMLLF